MASYGTDLSYFNDGSYDSTGDTGTEGGWGEFSDYDGGGSPGEDDENFIQGNNCISQTTGTKTGLDFSIAFDAGSDQSGSISSGYGVFVWQYFSTPEAIESFANGGMQIAIGDSLAGNVDLWEVGGSNYGRFPYGGWQNNVVCPNEVSPDTDGGASGDWQAFGSLVYIVSAIAKGYPHACDAIRYGRGEIYCTGTGANFDDMAQENDYNDAVNGYHRWGLFQAQQGAFLWKGLMSLGQSGTSVTFSDSNKTIFVDYCPKVYAAFNKIEINNSGSSVTWANISITALGTTSPGNFEMVDNATVSMTGCIFTDMGSFVFDTGATLSGCIFNGCGQITHGGADFSSCIFQGYEGSSDSSYVDYDVNADPDGELDNCYFTKGTASTHAINFGTTCPATMTLRGITFSGYNASNGNTDSTLYFEDGDEDYTINLIGCSGNISYKQASGTGSVTLVTNPVTFTVIVKDVNTNQAIQNARVLVWVKDATNYPYQASVSIVSSGTTATVTHSTHGLATNDWVLILGANEECYNGVYQITYSDANTYTYTMAESGSSPATGTITATFCPIHGLTDGSGEISDSRTYASGNQDVAGWARRASSGYGTLYKQAPLDDEIDNSDGLTVTIYMIPDE